MFDALWFDISYLWIGVVTVFSLRYRESVESLLVARKHLFLTLRIEVDKSALTTSLQNGLLCL